MISDYLNFIRKNGRPLSEINPGSTEYALKVDDAFRALEIALKADVGILGGDILSENKNNGLIYAYQLWGEKYHCLDWYCDQEPNESNTDYTKRSNEVARLAIIEANRVAEKLGKKCLITIVI